jgi:hypothetical protein
MSPLAPRRSTPFADRRRRLTERPVEVLLACAAVLLTSGLVPVRALQSSVCLPRLPGETAQEAIPGGADAAAAAGVPLLPLLPPLWKTGETHAHVQLCDGAQPMSVEVLLARQQAEERQVSFAQLWGINETLRDFLAEWAPLVTGDEHAVSDGDLDYVIQFGIEVSKFPADQFGHIQCAGISDPMLPLEASYPKPILEAARAQPNAITGYAHVFWPMSYALGPIDPYYGGIGYLAPTDAALGLIDFVEAVFQRVDSSEYDWRGMYYKLLNAGLRPSLTSGRDNTCTLQPYDEMMTARIESEPLTFDKWADAIRAGRTTVAEGRKFLDLHVNGAGIGSSVRLDGPGLVTAELSLTVGEDHEGQLRIVHDGKLEAGGQAYSLVAGETRTVKFTVPVLESGWIAGEAKGADSSDAHTGAIYVIVGDQPICRPRDAEYCIAYGNAILDNLDAFTFGSAAERQAVVAHIGAGRRVFEALRAGALPLPTGVARYGTSTPACQGPIQIGVSDLPTAGNPRFAITNVHAPAHAAGWLVMGTGSLQAPMLVAGTELHVDLGAFHVLHPVVANSGGYHEFGAEFPAALQGTTLYWQYVWTGVEDCGASPGGLSASDAIAVTVL